MTEPERRIRRGAPAPVAPDDAFAWMYRLLQLARVLLELRQRFQNHVVLVELRVHRADLPLAEGVVQRVVDGRRRDAQARGGDAVDDQRNRQPAGLLVGGHVFQFRQLLQLLDEAVGPQVQLVRIGIFERVLVLRAAHAVIHRDVLHRLHEELDALHLLQLRSAAGESRRRR